MQLSKTLKIAASFSILLSTVVLSPMALAKGFITPYAKNYPKETEIYVEAKLTEEETRNWIKGIENWLEIPSELTLETSITQEATTAVESKSEKAFRYFKPTLSLGYWFTNEPDFSSPQEALKEFNIIVHLQLKATNTDIKTICQDFGGDVTQMTPYEYTIIEQKVLKGKTLKKNRLETADIYLCEKEHSLFSRYITQQNETLVISNNEATLKASLNQKEESSFAKQPNTEKLINKLPENSPIQFVGHFRPNFINWITKNSPATTVMQEFIYFDKFKELMKANPYLAGNLQYNSDTKFITLNSFSYTDLEQIDSPTLRQAYQKALQTPEDSTKLQNYFPEKTVFFYTVNNLNHILKLVEDELLAKSLKEKITQFKEETTEKTGKLINIEKDVMPMTEGSTGVALGNFNFSNSSPDFKWLLAFNRTDETQRFVDLVLGLLELSQKNSTDNGSSKENAEFRFDVIKDATNASNQDIKVIHYESSEKPAPFLSSVGVYNGISNQHLIGSVDTLKDIQGNTLQSLSSSPFFKSMTKDINHKHTINSVYFNFEPIVDWLSESKTDSGYITSLFSKFLPKVMYSHSRFEPETNLFQSTAKISFYSDPCKPKKIPLKTKTIYIPLSGSYTGSLTEE